MSEQKYRPALAGAAEARDQILAFFAGADDLDVLGRKACRAETAGDGLSGGRGGAVLVRRVDPDELGEDFTRQGLIGAERPTLRGSWASDNG
jgi:hypothetical protein